MIDYLSKLNPHDRDKNIKFFEKGHIYLVNGKKGFTSVTTWIHTLFEKFDADKIIYNMQNSKNWINNKYYGLNKEEIKEIWNKNREESATSGTNLHLDIEKFYNKILVQNNSIEYKFFLNFVNDYKHLIPYRTEMLVYDEDLKLSGSVDMIFKNENDNFEIYDWKRSKEIKKTNEYNKWILNDKIEYIPDSNFWHYSLQLNLYRYILKNKYNFLVEGMYLVILYPDNVNYKRLKVPLLEKEIEILIHSRKNK